MAAGRVIGAVLLALLGGLLFNAGDILSTARRQPAGWLRTAAVAFMEPVASFSHATRLDRPRLAIDAALGRPPSSPFAAPEPTSTTTTTMATTTSTTVPERRRPVSSADPLRLFIGGDSMVGQFGPMLANRAEASGLATTTEVIYEFESGITRPDFVDWPMRMEEVTAAQDPDVVVLLFGGNDAQSIRIGGRWEDFGTEAWIAEYQKRVGGLMRQIASEGRDLYWVGMPIVSSEDFRARVEILNEVFRTEAASIEGVTYFDSWPLFQGPDGGYAEYLPDADGDVVDMRLNDGVHLTTDGGIRLASAVWDTIATNWEIAEG